MAESDEILVGLEAYKQGIENLITLTQQWEKELKGAANAIANKSATAGMPTDTAGLQAHTKAVKDALIVDGQLTKAQKDKIMYQTELTRLNAIERNQIKDSIALQNAHKDSYTATSIEMKNLMTQWKNADATLRNQLTPQIDALNNKLKSMDATVGVHTRNVGNYTSALKGTAIQISGLSGLMAIFGRIIGIDTQQLEALHEIHTTLRESSRDLSHLTHQHTEATAEHTAAMEADVAATEELEVAQKEESETSMAALGVFGLMIGAVIGLVAAYESYSEAKRLSKLADEAEKEALKEDLQIKQDLLKVENELAIAEGKTTKSQVSNSEALEKSITATEAAKKARDARMAELENQSSGLTVRHTAPTAAQGTIEYQNQLKMYQSYLNAKAVIDQEYNDRITNAYNLYSKTVDLNNTENADKNLLIQDKIQESKDKALKESFQSEMAVAADERRLKIDELKKDEQYANNRKLVELEYLDAVEKIREKYAKKDEEDKKKALEAAKKAYEQFLEYAKKQYEFEGKSMEEQMKRLEELQKLRDEMQEKHTNNTYEDIIATDRLRIEHDKMAKKIDYANLLSDENELVGDEANKKKADIAYQQQKDIMKAKALGVKDGDEIIVQINQDAQDKMDTIDREAAQKRLRNEKDLTEKLKEEYKKRVEAQAKIEEEIIQAIQSSIDKKISLEEAANQTEQEMLGAQLQAQAALAAAGKKNSMDQVLKDQAKAQEEQKALARKAHQEQEAADLASLFIKAMSAYESAGQNPAQAATKAMADVLLAKAISAGIQAAFFEGTENTGPGGHIDSKGGFLAVMHPNERVIPSKYNQLLGGVSNEDLVNKYLSYADMPIFGGSLVDERLLSKIDGLQSAMAEVKEAIENQPHITAYTNSKGEYVKEIIKGGNSVTIIRPNSDIVKTLRPK